MAASTPTTWTERQLHWVLPDAPFTPLPLELFMRQYYEPRLLPRLLAHDPTLTGPSPASPDLNRVQPLVKITQVVPHSDDPAIVDVTVTAARASAVFHQDGQDVPTAPASTTCACSATASSSATCRPRTRARRPWT